LLEPFTHNKYLAPALYIVTNIIYNHKLDSSPKP